MSEKRININGQYLIIAPNEERGLGYHHQLAERAFLADNLKNFLEAHRDIEVHQITIYELREVNEHKGCER
jgi:hypothetical protein